MTSQLKKCAATGPASFLAWSLFFLLFFAYLQAQPTFPDPDSWYHLRLAMIEQQTGLPQTFPWLPHTILADHFVDHHLLYHLLLIPFLYIWPPFAAIKIFTLISALAVLAVLAVIAKKYATGYVVLLPLFLISIPAWLFRINLAKASSLGIICFILLLHFWWQKNRLGLFLTAFFYALLYNGWIVGFLTVTILAIYEYITTKKFATCYMLHATGIVAGLLLNPYFPNNLIFAWQHIVATGFSHAFIGGQSGNEWSGLTFQNGFATLGTLGLFLLPVIVLTIVHWRQLSQITREVWLLMAVFLVATIFSQRLLEFFVPLVILAALITLANIFPDPKTLWVAGRDTLQNFLAHRSLLTRPLAVALVFLLIFRVSLSLDDLVRQFSTAKPTTYGRELGTWLQEHAISNTLVLNSDFSLFPPLWFWSGASFLSGLDPSFSLALPTPFTTPVLKLLTPNQPQELKNLRAQGWRVLYFDHDFILLNPYAS